MAPRIFVATRTIEIPADARPFVSVDGSVQGALATWDHHVTGEPVNLDAMPPLVEVPDLRGIGTTMADTDALASVVAVLAGGKARLPGPVLGALHAASHRCDHLVRAPGSSDEADRVGLALHRWVSGQLAAAGSSVSTVFEALCLDVHERVRHGLPLPAAPPGPAVPVQALFDEGRVKLGRTVASFDLRDRGGMPPEALQAAHDRRVAVIVQSRHGGGVAYTVGVNPFIERPLVDIRPALVALARAEHRHGPPCLAPDPVPGAENWGGRASVFGSPWNYGSRLEPAEVVEICERELGGM